MARTPLFPRGGDFTAWALNITQRIERDYAQLTADDHSISAVITADLHSVSAVINTDIRSLSATLMLRSRHALNVKDYGAIGDGSVNEVTAITSAITAMPTIGAGLYFPMGIYKVKSPLVLNKAGLYFGDGPGTIIRNSVNGVDVFQIQTNGVRLRDMTINAGVSLSSGYAVNIAASNVRVEAMSFSGQYVGIYLASLPCTVVTIRGIYMGNTKYAGFIIHSGDDLSISDVLMDATPNTRIGIDIEAVSSLMINDVRIIHADFGIYSATANSIRKVDVNNSYIDTTSTAGVYLTPLTNGSIAQTSFNNCQIIGSTYGIVLSPATSAGTTGVSVIGCRIATGADHDIYMNSNARFTNITGCILGSAITGIYVDGAQHTQIVNNHIGVRAGFGSNTTGVYIAAASDYFIVANNNLLGNVTNLNNAAGVGATKIVEHNMS